MDLHLSALRPLKDDHIEDNDNNARIPISQRDQIR